MSLVQTAKISCSSSRVRSTSSLRSWPAEKAGPLARRMMARTSGRTLCRSSSSVRSCIRGVDRALRCSGRFSVMRTAGRASSTSKFFSSNCMATLYRVLLTYDGRCFGCGQENEEGLKMRFEPTGDGSVCLFEVPERYRSWRGMIHGGMIALMLDEAVGWASWHAGHPGLTGRLEVRFRQPLRFGDRVRVVGRVEKVRRTLVYASAFIERIADQERIAEATATLMATPTELTAPCP